jgi:hypothetical protein
MPIAAGSAHCLRSSTPAVNVGGSQLTGSGQPSYNSAFYGTSAASLVINRTLNMPTSLDAGAHAQLTAVRRAQPRRLRGRRYLATSAFADTLIARSFQY